MDKLDMMVETLEGIASLGKQMARIQELLKAAEMQIQVQFKQADETMGKIIEGIGNATKGGRNE